MRTDFASFRSLAQARLLRMEEYEAPASASPALHGDFQHGDFRLFGAHPAPVPQDFKPAAVLIAIDSQSQSVVLTERAAHLRRHAGQIAFPGGRVDASDADITATALREAKEEIGLSPAACDVIGFLPEYYTGTGYRVAPVIAMLDGLPDWQIDAGEVAAVFTVPLAVLLDPARHCIEERDIGGTRRSFYAIRHERHFIWGVTAGIIRQLYERLHPC